MTGASDNGPDGQPAVEPKSARITADEAFAVMGSDVSTGSEVSDKAQNEEDALVEDEAEDEYRRGARLRNDSDEQDMGERKRYAENAYGITQAWVGFLIVITIAQMCLKTTGLGLSQAEFITFVTTTTASIFGFWLLVGNYLFRGNSRKSEKNK